jgi:hypothetical protein
MGLQLEDVDGPARKVLQAGLLLSHRWDTNMEQVLHVRNKSICGEFFETRSKVFARLALLRTFQRLDRFNHQLLRPELLKIACHFARDRTAPAQLVHAIDGCLHLVAEWWQLLEHFATCVERLWTSFT